MSGFVLSGFVCFLATLVVVVSATPAPWAATPGKTVRVGDLPPPTSGVLGLSRLIEPFYQANQLWMYYPQSQGADPIDRVSQISFNCTQATKRFVVNINPEWELYPVDYVGGIPVAELFFNPADDTLILDLEENLMAGTQYSVEFRSGVHIIDEDDRYGIQAFNRTSDDTGESQITIGLSSAPKSLRRFIPCFDDPVYQVHGYWWVYVHNGPNAHPITFIKGKLAGAYYTCPPPPAPPSVHYSQYYYHYPKMAAEAMTFRIVPFAWYQGDDFPEPPSSCH